MLDPKDLIIDVMDKFPPGGQQCGLMPQVVRVLHKPSGLFACCGTAGSQFRNKEIAIQMIEWGLMLAEEYP